jgi:integrase
MVRDIKPSELGDYQTNRKKAGSAESTIDQELGAAKSVINKAFEDDLIAGDTLKRFKQVKKYLRGIKRNSNARKRVLSHGEFLKILYALPWHSRGVFSTAYYTGMRLGEILALTWDILSLKDRKITLPKEITKDEEERVIPIGDTLYSFLKKIPTPLHNNHVFLNYGRTIKDIRGGLKNACEEAGVIYGRFAKEGFIEHDLRHTFVTNMRKAGVHNDVTNAITGHSDGSMRSRYDTVSLKDMMEGIKKLEEHLENVYQTVYQAPYFNEKEVSQISANPL